MKFYWFGDSWVRGDELDKLLPVMSWQKSAFAQLVSDHYGAECVNLGINGCGVDNLPWEFYKVAGRIDPQVDKVFFFLSSDLRTWMFDATGQPRCLIPYPGFVPSHAHVNWKEWFVYFDNPYQRSYTYDKSIDLLYMWCKNLGVQFYFCNIFTTQETPMMDLTSPHSWLLPRNQCIATAILPYIDNDSGLIFVDDIPKFTVRQWEEQKIHVEKYIKPLWCHPNVEGHEKIAEFIIELLDKASAQDSNRPGQST